MLVGGLLNAQPVEEDDVVRELVREGALDRMLRAAVVRREARVGRVEVGHGSCVAQLRP